MSALGIILTAPSRYWSAEVQSVLTCVRHRSSFLSHVSVLVTVSLHGVATKTTTTWPFPQCLKYL